MRLDGWEARLWEILKEAAERPYELGKHDCFRLACSVYEALTGVDRWQEFAGKYSTASQARRLIARRGRSFEAAGDWFFGSTNVPASYAQRGDIIGFADDAGEKHLGICAGAKSAVLGPHGLIWIPTLTAFCAWKI